MKKTFKLTDLECANCAAKMERDCSMIDGVNEVTINFMMQKMKIDAEDEKFDEILDQVDQIIKKYESGCSLVR